LIDVLIVLEKNVGEVRPVLAVMSLNDKKMEKIILYWRLTP